jgi:hypothetical protein
MPSRLLSLKISSLDISANMACVVSFRETIRQADSLHLPLAQDLTSPTRGADFDWKSMGRREQK